MIGSYDFFNQEFVFLHQSKSQGKVHATFPDGLYQLVLFQEHHFDMYLRICLGKSVDGIGNESRESESRSNTKIACRQSLNVLDALHAILGICHSLTGKRQEILSGLAEKNTFANTLKQRCAQIVLQLLDLLRKRTLRDVTPKPQNVCKWV